MSFAKSWGYAAVALALAASLAIAAACGDDGSADEEAVEQAVLDAVTAYNAGDADAFFAAFTDKGFAQLAEVPVEDVAEAKEEFKEFIGEEPLENPEVRDTEVDGEAATAVLRGESAGVIEVDTLSLIKEGETWKVDGIELYGESPDIPDGYAKVAIAAQEFAFGVDTDKIKGGKMAFEVENVGEQMHEVVLVSLAEGLDLQEALMSESEEEPEWIEFIARVQVDPGDAYNMVLLEDLAPARYAFVCFFPDIEDPEMTPHAFKGMTQEFTIE